MKGFWNFLNSQFFLVILGFALTYGIGTSLSNRFQEKSWEKQFELEKERQNAEWKRDKKFELLRRKLNEGQQVLEEISNLIHTRFFKLQRVYNNIAVGDLKNAEKNWKDYYESVEEWNIKLGITQNKIRRLVDEEAADRFNNYETDHPHLQSPESIHGMFFLAHKRVFNLLRCLRNADCELNNSKKQLAAEILNSLDVIGDAFVDDISDLFIQKTLELEEFE